MSNGLWTAIGVIVGVAIVFLSRIFNFPLWIVLSVFIPISIIAMTSYSALYNLRPDLKPEIVDTGKFKEQIEQLETDKELVESLNFSKIDSFTLKIIPETLIYIFEYKESPVYLCLYHFGPKIACDLVTSFTKDLSLSTASAIDGGNIPRDEKALLQIFPDISYSDILKHHLTAIDFIKTKGYDTVPPPSGSVREELMKSIRKDGERIKKIPFWPVMLLVWVITQRGKIHAQSIEEQYKKGLLKVFK